MNILEVIRARIRKAFPDITVEELEIRVSIAEKLLEHLKN